MIPELNNIIVDFYLDNYTWKSLIKRISNNNYDDDRKNMIDELSDCVIYKCLNFIKINLKNGWNVGL